MIGFNEYQRKAQDTAVYPVIKELFVYPAMGLAGEAGELLNKIKKHFRDGTPMPLLTQQVKDELGDILWYVATLAKEFGLQLDLVAEANLEKLAKRKAKGTIHGSGDSR